MSRALLNNLMWGCLIAGRFILKSVEDATAEDWDAILGSNVKGYAFATKHAMRVMKTGGPKGDRKTVGECQHQAPVLLAGICRVCLVKH